METPKDAGTKICSNGPGHMTMMAHARIQEFSSGVGQVSLTKKLRHFFFVFLSPQLILQKSNGQFQRNL